MFGFSKYKSHPERTRAALTPNMKMKIKELVGKCEFCREEFEAHQLDIHHIDEACNANGSSDKNTPGNLIVVCSYCHNEYHRAKTITKTEFKKCTSKRSKSIKSKLRSILKGRVIVSDKNDNGMSAMRKIVNGGPMGITPMLFGNSKK